MYRFILIPQTPDQHVVLESGFLESQQSGTLVLPTGAGKTALARVAMLATLSRGQKAIYLAPTKGVLEEQYHTWQGMIAAAQLKQSDPVAELPELPVVRQMSLLGAAEFVPSELELEPEPQLIYQTELKTAPVVGLFNSDHPASLGDYQRSDLLLLTPERLDICLRHPSVQNEDHWIRQVGLCVIDELQTIGDGHRGVRLEGALVRLRWINPGCRWLGLSANLNPQDSRLLDWVGPYRYWSTVRPVPQIWRVLRYRNRTERLQNLVSLLQQSPYLTLVFVNSRRATESLAAQLQRSGITAAAHHAGLSLDQRRSAEQMFANRQLQVLVATTTLGVGVNLPARQVVIYDLYRPNRQSGTARTGQAQFVPLTREEVQQLGGRAGRPGLDPQGDVVLMAQGQDNCTELLPQSGKMAAAPLVKSALPKQRAWIVEQVLALVAGGYGQSAEAISRVLDTSLAAAESELSLGEMHDLLQRLTRGLMLQPDEEGIGLVSTDLGALCASHYLMPATGLRWAYSLEQVVKQQESPTYLDWLALIALAMDWWLGQGAIINLSRSLWLAEGTAQARLHCQQQPQVQTLYTHAEILRTYTRSGANLSHVIGWAGDVGVRLYRADLQTAAEEAVRLSESLREIAQTLKGARPVPALELADGRLQVLRQMLATGLDSHLVSLTLLPDIGPKRALALKKMGFLNLAEVAQASPEQLMQVNGITSERAEQIIQQALVLQSQIQPEWFQG